MLPLGVCEGVSEGVSEVGSDGIGERFVRRAEFRLEGCPVPDAAGLNAVASPSPTKEGV
jgi:hypothetical protein